MQLDDMAVVKKRRKKRMKDPTRAKHLPFIYVVYAWSQRTERWFLHAFVRGSDRLTTKRMAKYRAKLSLPEETPTRFVELFAAAAFPGDENDPVMAYAVRRHESRKRFAPDESALNTSFRPRIFPKRRPIEPSHARSKDNGSHK